MAEGATERAGRRRNPRGQGSVLREQFIAAAAHLLATMDRPETLTLRQVAREVGAAPASVYSHFPDLDTLIAHVLQQRFAELGEVMRQAADSSSDPLHDLVAQCAAYVRWGVDHPGEYRTIIGGGMPAGLAPLSAAGAGEELLQTVSASLAAAAQLEPESEPVAALMLWTALHGLVSLYNEHGQIDWPPLNDLIISVLHLHTGRAVVEIEAALTATSKPGRQESRASGGVRPIRSSPGEGVDAG